MVKDVFKDAKRISYEEFIKGVSTEVFDLKNLYYNSIEELVTEELRIGQPANVLNELLYNKEYFQANVKSHNDQAEILNKLSAYMNLFNELRTYIEKNALVEYYELRTKPEGFMSKYAVTASLNPNHKDDFVDVFDDEFSDDEFL